MFLYLFNPDNDLALGNNSVYYQAPASALKMAADLAVLPGWIASHDHAMVIVPDKDAVVAWMNDLALQPQVEWGTMADGLEFIDEICPWGWNGALVRMLKEKCASAALLPTDNELARLRHLSSRLRAVEVLSTLSVIRGTCGVSHICTSLDDVESLLLPGVEQEEWNTERMLLKAPWSGSGKGLRWICGGMFDEKTRNWCRRVLAAQQAVVVEPYYQKVQDFAMEFWADGTGNVSFLGYSLFRTDANGAYKGNVLLSDGRIEAEITRWIPMEVLRTARQELLLQLMATLQKDYRGFLGVDMMVCSFAEEPCYRLHPCVEINLRTNMGVVAHTLYNRWVSPGSEGLFQIEYFKTSGLLSADHLKQTHDHPLVVENGRMVSGYLSLTPVGEHTQYRAALWVTPVNK